ncbi:MAG TPA: M48 family metallopeptidase [Blastocatellia bacterium]|nr:M48 family metallopeptidase [Blastocatellia bacterium]
MSSDYDAPSKMRCRYCGQLNKLANGKGEAAVCGRCRLPLSDEPHKKFANLQAKAYIHPYDSQALATLKMIPGVDSILKKLLEITHEAYSRVLFNANSVKVGPDQYPDLDAKLDIVCCTLGVAKPDFYVSVTNPFGGGGLGFNAFTGGVEKPFIVVFAPLIERLNDQEVLAVLGHEVGHIHAQHLLYKVAAELLMLLTRSALAISPIASLASLVTIPIQVALLNWYHKAELSCDRAGLLVTQDPNIIVSTMMKLAGGTLASKVNHEEFINQARQFQKNYEERLLDKFWTVIAAGGMSHPFPVWRVSEILEWVDQGGYKKVMEEEN